MLASLRRRFAPALARCGEVPQTPTFTDPQWAAGAISPDQQRIMALLPKLARPDDRWLHVGIRSSALASEFAARISTLDGVTIHAAEVAVAQALNLPNYTVHTVNKYGTGLAALPGTYALIVDNNPGSFACCTLHFEQMMRCYAKLLAPNGRLLTDSQGAGWRVRGGIALGWRHWVSEGARVGLHADRLSATVWSLTLH